MTRVKICQGAPSINHLLFADDSLLLFKITNQSAGHLQDILSLYEVCSGQMINKEKSSVMFSRNTHDSVRRNFMASLDIVSEAHNEKYLGLPVYLGEIQNSGFLVLER